MRKWIYCWASSDGFRHEGEIEAEGKDAAYAALRAQGIHPIRVVERIVPVERRGLKGLRKRDITLLALVTAVLAAGVAIGVVRWSGSRAPLRVVTSDGRERELRLSDPDARRELRRLAEKRRAEELAYHRELVERVRKGNLNRETANEIFRAMHLPEIPAQ